MEAAPPASNRWGDEGMELLWLTKRHRPVSRQPSSKVAQEGSHFSLDLQGAVQRVEVVGTGQGPHPAAPEGPQPQGQPPSLWVWQPGGQFHHLPLPLLIRALLVPGSGPSFDGSIRPGHFGRVLLADAHRV